MVPRTRPSYRPDAGFTIIEVMIVLVIIGVLSAIALPMFERTIQRSTMTGLAADGKVVYDAFMRYYNDKGTFPSTSSPADRAFNLTTMSPLTTGGYVKSSVPFTSKLQNRRFTAYDSPNVGSSDTQFWLVMTHRRNPSIVVLVANTNQYPGYAGTWFDGVYFIRGSAIVSMNSAL